MKALISIFSLLLVLMITGFAYAAGPVAPGVSNPNPTYNGNTFRGAIQIRSDRGLFVDYVAPKPNMPTIVILNGLTYSTLQWDEFVAPLIRRGVGILRYDMFGMGQTILHYGFPLGVITYEQQVLDLKQLLTVMRIRGPYNIVGLSYGGGIGIAYATKFPNDIADLILMAPFTQAVASQDALIKKMIPGARIAAPYMTDEQLYDQCLKFLVYTTYPAAEPVITANPFGLEGVFEMVKGIRKFRPLESISQLPKHVHLMVAANDQYIERPVLDAYWAAVPTPSKASRILVNDSEHKIPEAVPSFAAAWVYEIVVKRNPLLYQGKDFQGFPKTGEIVYNGGKFKITDSSVKE